MSQCKKNSFKIKILNEVLKYDKFYMILCYKQPYFPIITTVQHWALKLIIMGDMLDTF